MYSTVALPVRVGSHRLTIAISRFATITCGDFLKVAMKKCKINGNTSSLYALWENANGVERMLDLNERLVASADVQLIVRRYRPSELKLLRNLNDKQPMVTKHCYAKRAEQQQQPPNTVQNPQATQQPPKLCDFHQKDIAKRLHQHNINFLRYLYVKLKSTKYDPLINEQSSLATDTGSCGTSRSASRSVSGSSIGLIDHPVELESCV
jgi:hypothetical protein